MKMHRLGLAALIGMLFVLNLSVASGEDTPAFQKWMKDVSALPAEKQVEAVAKKLVELNPDFDGLVEHRIDDGVVTQLSFHTLNVADISPVKVLTGLAVLVCSSESYCGNGKLTDLSALKGMSLKSFKCSYNPVSDFSALKGMPLESLAIFGSSSVSDLSSLKGLPLKELDCNWSMVSDLSPLRGMSLRKLGVSDTRISDLTPLAGMPLVSLEFYHTRVADLTPLKGLPLTELRCSMTKVTDLTPLKGMSLQSFTCHDAPVADLSPLSGMPLKFLGCRKCNVADFTPLKPMKCLEHLHCDYDIERDGEILYGIKSLKTINGDEAADVRKAIEEKLGKGL